MPKKLMFLARILTSKEQIEVNFYLNYCNIKLFVTFKFKLYVKNLFKQHTEKDFKEETDEIFENNNNKVFQFERVNNY